MDDRRFRFDLFIALSALLVSAIAAGASAYQTYVIRQQFSATVWPYLNFVNTSSSLDAGAGSFFEIDVANVGIGPALVRSALVTRDGKTVLSTQTVPALQAAFGPEMRSAIEAEQRAGAHEHGTLSFSSLDRGDVVPPGGKSALVRATGRFFTAPIARAARRVDLSLCYCSLLGQCWTKRLWDPSDEPQAIARCPA